MGPGLLVMAAVFFGIAVLLPVTAAEASPSKGCSDIPFAVNRRNPIKQDILSLTVCKNKNATPLSFALIGEYSKQLIINADK